MFEPRPLFHVLRLHRACLDTWYRHWESMLTLGQHPCTVCYPAKLEKSIRQDAVPNKAGRTRGESRANGALLRAVSRCLSVLNCEQ